MGQSNNSYEVFISNSTNKLFNKIKRESADQQKVRLDNLKVVSGSNHKIEEAILENKDYDRKVQDMFWKKMIKKNKLDTHSGQQERPTW